MKKVLFVSVALLAMVIFAGGVLAQTSTKPADKPAAPAAESKVSQGMEAMGTVAAYEAGKMIKVKEKDKESAFDVSGDTKINGEVKVGAKVTVMYKKDGGKTIATAITVVAEKSPAPAPAEKKTEKKN